VACWRRKRAPAEGAQTAGPLYRPALLTGLALLVLGIGIYLPIDGVSGRYTMPAVWGADLLLAVVLTRLLQAEATRWRSSALAALGCCLLVLVFANVGKQWKRWARIEVYWQALEYVEQNAPPGARVAWVGTQDTAPGKDLGLSEGIHFGWHLKNRGLRPDLSVRVAPGGPGLPGAEQPRLILCSSPAVQGHSEWAIVKRFKSTYWAGSRSFECCLLEPPAEGGPGS
jgi:hypothetical protein